MSKTDEIFEKLEYGKYEDLRKIHYINKENERIIFNKDIRKFYKESDEYEDYITMQELQAINEKVKELGWNE